MTYAIIDFQGHQLVVKEGEFLKVARLPSKEGQKIKLDQVLLYHDGKEPKIGTPLVKNVCVEATVKEHLLGPKLRVAKFKAKSRYRKVTGFRPKLTEIKIEKISLEK